MGERFTFWAFDLICLTWHACLFSIRVILSCLYLFSTLIKPSHGARSLWLLAWLPPRPDVAIPPPQSVWFGRVQNSFWWRNRDQRLVKVALLAKSRAGQAFWSSEFQLPARQGCLLPAALNNVCLYGDCSVHTDFWAIDFLPGNLYLAL